MTRYIIIASLFLIVAGWGCYMFRLISQIEKIKKKINRSNDEASK